MAGIEAGPSDQFTDAASKPLTRKTKAGNEGIGAERRPRLVRALRQLWRLQADLEQITNAGGSTPLAHFV